MKIKLRYFCCVLIFIISSCSPYYKTNSDENKNAIADKAIYLQDVKVLLQQKWPENRTINIVCHGHSVPAGYFKTPDVRTFYAYPHLLHKRLKKRFPFAVLNVIVTAVGGENSQSGAKRFERDVFSLNPDVITIDYALNDRGVGLEKAKKAWTSMIELAKLKGIKIILLTPTADKRAKLNDANDQLNLHAEQIRDLAKKHQVGLVDSYAAFKQYVQDGDDLSDLMSQVNHPNRKGHELVVKELFQWFTK
jgi:acyl-CoA thioesterase I